MAWFTYYLMYFNNFAGLPERQCIGLHPFVLLPQPLSHAVRTTKYPTRLCGWDPPDCCDQKPPKKMSNDLNASSLHLNPVHLHATSITRINNLQNYLSIYAGFNDVVDHTLIILNVFLRVNQLLDIAIVLEPPIIEDKGSQATVAKSASIFVQAQDLLQSKTVCHDDDRRRTWSHWQVEPGMEFDWRWSRSSELVWHKA